MPSRIWLFLRKKLQSLLVATDKNRKNNKTDVKNNLKGDLVYVCIAKGRFTRKLKHHKEKLVASKKTGPFRVFGGKTKDTYLVQLSSDPPISAEFNKVFRKPCLNSRTKSLKGGGNEPCSRDHKTTPGEQQETSKCSKLRVRNTRELTQMTMYGWVMNNQRSVRITAPS